MSWYNKVAWSEGLFLRPQLFQQQERYLEHLAHKRAATLSPFFWGFIRRYMEEGPEAVPKPKRLIGHAPSLREAWLSVTQWYPAFQQKGAIGNISDGITLLILPVIALIVAGNFIGQCLTWQARFPKEIENAGRG